MVWEYFLFGILSEWFMLQLPAIHFFMVVLFSILLGYEHFVYPFTSDGLLDDFEMNKGKMIVHHLITVMCLHLSFLT